MRRRGASGLGRRASDLDLDGWEGPLDLLLTLARTGRIDKLSGGLCRSDDYAAVKERMAGFMAAGIHWICSRPRDTVAAAEVRGGEDEGTKRAPARSRSARKSKS